MDTHNVVINPHDKLISKSVCIKQEVRPLIHWQNKPPLMLSRCNVLIKRYDVEATGMP